ncbi:MAG: aldo/keto reductase [Alphaproteobacteria bacterium]|nr:aldo/keto reductase [Alphaproteobacteria bacterium]
MTAPDLAFAPIHPDGPALSRFVWGAWRLAEADYANDPGAVASVIEELVTLGVTSIDHADIYGGYTCEALFGAAIKARPSLRDAIQIVTKTDIALISPNRPDHLVKHYDTSRDHILASVDRSLANLSVDYIDLLLLHRPDPLMDADETAGALSAVRAAGKVGHIGVSNFTPSQMALLQSRLDSPLVTNQIELSALHLDPLHDGTLDYLQQHRMRPMIWSPLAGADLLTGTSERHKAVRDVMEGMLEETGAETIVQLALAFILRHPSKPLPILGSMKMDRLRSMIAAERITLTRQQWFSIWQASAGREVP